MKARPAGLFDGKMTGKIAARPADAKPDTPQQKAFGSLLVDLKSDNPDPFA